MSHTPHDDSTGQVTAREAMLPAGHAMVLGMTAAGAPLGSVLHAITELIEMDVTDARCSVMLLDADGVLHLAAGSSLPADYVAALAGGVPVGEAGGPFGAAVASGRPVVVADVAASPRWWDHAEAAVRNGLHACWSVPIMGEGGRALGAFALYYGTCREPASSDIQQLSGFAQLVAVAVQQDRTARALEHAQRVDPLTGLPDREQLSHALEEALARYGRRAGQWVAVAAIEMRRLREANEAFGYRGGDELILQAAQRLTGLLGGDGHVFRTGGSGFTVILHDEAHVDPLDLPRRFLERLSAPLTVAGSAFVPSPRIGLAVTTEAMHTAEALLQGAQGALRTARRANGPMLLTAGEAEQGRAAQQLAVESDLRRGLAAGELVPHYQPQYALDTGQVVGVEALVRWEHPDRGQLAPEAFIDAVETGNLHTELLHTMLRQTCRDAADWWERHPDLPLTAAVNLFPEDLHDRALPDVVAAALRDSGLPGGLLCLEVTEQAALIDVDAAVAALQRLRALGVKVAMDDFGTGYSSLSYAGRLPIDSLKVDRSFLHDVADNPANVAVITAMVGLADGLGIEVLAEGIETEEQRRIVADLGCHAGQGYLWSPAVPAAAIEDLLSSAAQGPPATPRGSGGRGAAQVRELQQVLLSIAELVHTPLSVLREQAALVGARAGDGELVEAAAAIERQVDDLRELLSAAHDVHDLAEGTLPLHRSAVSLRDVVEQAAGDLAGGLPVPVQLEAAPEVVAHGDAARIRQILVQLLTNAGKHSPPDSAIAVRIGSDGRRGHVQVRDHGPGLSADKVDGIFGRRVRTDPSRPGLGLGLHIARELARHHGGDLTHQHAEPTGAVFTLTLPLVPDRAGEPGDPRER